MLGDIADSLLALAREHRQWMAPLVFLMGFAESIPLLSLFVPSTVLFLGIGAANGAAGGSFLPLWLAAAAGATIGDIVTFTAGRLLEGRIVTSWPLSRNPQWWHRSHDLFERWGILAIVAGKFMGPLRSVIPIIAGVLEMPFPWFLLGSAVSSLIWAAAFLGPGSFGIGWLID